MSSIFSKMPCNVSFTSTANKRTSKTHQGLSRRILTIPAHLYQHQYQYPNYVDTFAFATLEED